MNREDLPRIELEGRSYPLQEFLDPLYHPLECARDNGYGAFFAGWQLHHVPYDPGDKRRDAWSQGWNAAFETQPQLFGQARGWSPERDRQYRLANLTDPATAEIMNACFMGKADWPQHWQQAQAPPYGPATPTA